MLKNSAERYGTLSKLLHWSMAAMILALIFVGVYMADLPRDTEAERQVTFQFYGLHKSIGILALLLIAVRIAWLRISPAPALPKAFEAREKRAVLGLQKLLYLLMVVVPLSGYVMSSAGGHPVSLFGLFNLPLLFDKSKGLGGFAHEAHEIMGFMLLLLVALHISGAIKHRLQERGGERDILKRML